MTTNPLIYVGAAVLVVAMLCATYLTAADKISGELYMTGVLSPIVAGFIGAVAAIKGVQSGSEASVSPPPDA